MYHKQKYKRQRLNFMYMLREFRSSMRTEKGSPGNLSNTQLCLKAWAKLTLFETLHVRQSIFSFHIIFLFKPLLKEETQIERGKFPPHGHSVVRRRSTIQTVWLQSSSFYL